MLWGLCQGQARQEGSLPPPQPGAGHPGAATIPGTGHLLGDDAGLRPGLDVGLWVGVHVWANGAHRGYNHGCGTEGAAVPVGAEGLRVRLKQVPWEGGLPTAVSGASPEASGGRDSPAVLPPG